MGNTFETTEASSSGGTLDIDFVVCNLGELVTLDEAPMLSSPATTYGLIRIDTGEVLIADGYEFTLVSDFLYRVSFLAPEEGLTYRYYVEAIVDDTTFHIPATTANSMNSMLAIGRYTNSWNIAQKFGYDNMQSWLSLPAGDTDSPTDFALRAYEFIDNAEKQIDNELIGPYYRGDGVEGDFADGVPELIEQMATALAAVMMYEARGVNNYDSDDNRPQHRLSYHRDWYEKQLKKVKYGITVLGTAGINPVSAPEADVSDVEEKV